MRACCLALATRVLFSATGACCAAAAATAAAFFAPPLWYSGQPSSPSPPACVPWAASLRTRVQWPQCQPWRPGRRRQPMFGSSAMANGQESFGEREEMGVNVPPTGGPRAGQVRTTRRSAPTQTCPNLGRTQTQPKFRSEMSHGWTKNRHSSVCVGALGHDFCPFQLKRTRTDHMSQGVGVGLTQPQIHGTQEVPSTRHGVSNKKLCKSQLSH